MSAAVSLPRVRELTCDAGRIIHGDNVEAMRAMLPELAGKVTLAYADPPFFTGQTFAHRDGRFAFADRWPSRAAYIDALRERLVLVRELLAPHGCVIVHVDPKTSHYVKVLGDEIFGDDAFASEIVWRYRRWPTKTPNFQRVHDVLLRFRKDPAEKPRFNVPYEPLAPSTLATWGTNKQRAVIEADGRRSRSRTTDEASNGVPMGDVWDIGMLAGTSGERTGYPTQKPEALLERIVTALSDPGDIVLDPYMGSGTTIAVAARMGRRFVGIDAGEVAFETARERLAKLGMEVR